MERPKIKIGIVDDHQLILDGLEKLLKTVEDYEIVFIENNANIALEYMRHNRVDLVITDVAMPHMNGAEFIKKIRQQNQNVKILVLSMYKTDLIDDNEISGYLLKESSSETILRKVKEVISKKRKKNTPSPVTLQHRLSKREKEIVIELSNGLSSEQIAEKLFLSYHTVETHKKNVFLKFGVNTIAEVVKKAMHIGII